MKTLLIVCFLVVVICLLLWIQIEICFQLIFIIKTLTHNIISIMTYWLIDWLIDFLSFHDLWPWNNMLTLNKIKNLFSSDLDLLPFTNSPCNFFFTSSSIENSSSGNWNKTKTNLVKWKTKDHGCSYLLSSLNSIFPQCFLACGIIVNMIEIKSPVLGLPTHSYCSPVVEYTQIFI